MAKKEMGDIFKRNALCIDIRPYDELKEAQAYDVWRCITAGIPLVVNNNT